MATTKRLPKPPKTHAAVTKLIRYVLNPEKRLMKKVCMLTPAIVRLSAQQTNSELSETAGIKPPGIMRIISFRVLSRERPPPKKQRYAVKNSLKRCLETMDFRLFLERT